MDTCVACDRFITVVNSNLTWFNRFRAPLLQKIIDSTCIPSSVTYNAFMRLGMAINVVGATHDQVVVFNTEREIVNNVTVKDVQGGLKHSLNTMYIVRVEKSDCGIFLFSELVGWIFLFRRGNRPSAVSVSGPKVSLSLMKLRTHGTGTCIGFGTMHAAVASYGNLMLTSMGERFKSRSARGAPVRNTVTDIECCDIVHLTCIEKSWLIMVLKTDGRVMLWYHDHQLNYISGHTAARHSLAGTSIIPPAIWVNNIQNWFDGLHFVEAMYTIEDEHEWGYSWIIVLIRNASGTKRLEELKMTNGRPVGTYLEISRPLGHALNIGEPVSIHSVSFGVVIIGTQRIEIITPEVTFNHSLHGGGSASVFNTPFPWLEDIHNCMSVLGSTRINVHHWHCIISEEDVHVGTYTSSIIVHIEEGFLCGTAFCIGSVSAPFNYIIQRMKNIEKLVVVNYDPDGLVCSIRSNICLIKCTTADGVTTHHVLSVFNITTQSARAIAPALVGVMSVTIDHDSLKQKHYSASVTTNMMAAARPHLHNIDACPQSTMLEGDNRTGMLVCRCAACVAAAPPLS